MTVELESPARGERQASAKGRPASSALVIVIAWMLFHLLLAAAHDTPILTGGLLGPDSYMRMVRVEALLDTGAWYDHRIERSNAPFGEELHWTRPFDLLLLAGAAPLAPLLGWKTFTGPARWFRRCYSSSQHSPSPGRCIASCARGFGSYPPSRS